MGRIRSRIKSYLEYLADRFAKGINNYSENWTKRQAWIKGYQACLQQYEFNYIPDNELDWRYSELKRTKQLEKVSQPR